MTTFLEDLLNGGIKGNFYYDNERKVYSPTRIEIHSGEELQIYGINYRMNGTRIGSDEVRIGNILGLITHDRASKELMDKIRHKNPELAMRY